MIADLSGNATTATTLQTARTINGTSFNGSGNITTANWGTARNIQIGNTSKSVNGSGNVSWSLSEIGAAASNHTHGLVNLNSEAFSGGNDLNTYNSTKTWVARTLNSTTNKPADYFTVVNFGANSNSNFQLAHSYANNSILYVRGRHDTSGNYTPWAKIYTDKNKPTASEIGAASASHTHNYAASSSAGGNANAAVKLATARSINGTNFDGSANITTANWGTARNVQIGNTAKSVNGSANVSWSLSEIGAAAASHTHSYVPLANGGNITIHADSDSSSTGEYALIKAGHNELKIASSAGGTTVTKGQDKLTFNGNIVYHAGRKPTISEIGAAAASHTHNYAGSSSAGGNANAAVKLATARTINGTNFDGSANITTANWGTARNIQIGNAVKSVNGSANVTWNWSEMQVPRAHSSSYSFGGNQNAITTAQFITMLTNLGAFSQVYWVSRGSWSYASNPSINDTGCGNIHLAGCVVEVIGNTSAYTIRVTTPTTSASGTTNAEFIYVNKITPGTRIVVCRSNEVIPYIMNVISDE